MANRNYKEEIAALQQRNEFQNGIWNFRISTLKSGLHLIKKGEDNVRQEFFKYLPIAAVASLESFMRSAVKSLIDKGDADLKMLSEILQRSSFKLDIEILDHLQKKKFTLGELISHLLPCNKLEQLLDNINNILNKDLWLELQTHVPRLAGMDDEDLFKSFQIHNAQIKPAISRMFHDRHIFCHESGNNFTIDEVQMEKDIHCCDLFLDMASHYIRSMTEENYGLTGHEYMEMAKVEYEAIDAELERKIQAFKAEQVPLSENQEGYTQMIQEKIATFRSFAIASAELQASYSPSYVWSNYAYWKDLSGHTMQLLKEFDAPF